MRPACSVLLLLLICLVAAARRLEVPGSYPTIQAAFDSSAPGDTVLVAPGTYHELLIAPTHDLTLASHYLFTNDTLDLAGTILDGQLQGTVITLPTGDYWFRLNGFVITGGWGGSGLDEPGGGLWVLADVNVDLKNLVFTGNGSQGAGVGAAAYGGFWLNEYGKVGEVRLANVQITNNNHVAGSSSPLNQAFKLRSRKRVTVSNLFCYGAGLDDAALWIDTRDSLFADTIRVIGYCGNRVIPANLRGGLYGHIRNVIVRNNHSFGGGWFGCGSSLQTADTARFHLENLLIEANVDSSDGNLSCSGFGGDVFTASNVICRDNRTLSATLLEVGAGIHGMIRNLVVENNIVGREEGPIADFVGTVVKLEDVSLDSARFHGNTAHLPRGPGQDYRRSPLVYGEYYLDTDSVTWEHVSFRNNWVYDHNLLEHNNLGIIGRALYLDGMVGGAMRLENCEWVNNRVNIIVPERDLFPGYRNVGSTVEIVGRTGADGTELILNNCLFQDNDDGGLYAAEFGSGLMQNCRFLRNNRFAAWFYSNNDDAFVTVRNTWFHGTNTQEYYLPYPQYQGVFHVHGTSGSLIENVTASACSTSFAISIGVIDDDTTRISNSLFWDLSYEDFIHTWNGSEQAGDFSYCMLDHHLPGVGNLVLNPDFDIDLGPPYLSPFSLAIDAGNPDPALNDLEDPTFPGFALWPSHGSLRNDIGVTGGPFAMAPDTGWATLVPRWEPRIQPQAFTMGAPWPNPFNPVTQIPYKLLQPGRVTLSVHNLLGQRVAMLADGLKPAGTHAATFDAVRLASGIYLITLEAAGKRETRTVTLLR